jgi:hypothetical protein
MEIFPKDFGKISEIFRIFRKNNHPNAYRPHFKGGMSSQTIPDTVRGETILARFQI